MNFVLTAIVNHVSNTLDEVLTGEQQEDLLNKIFNGMNISLNPEAQYYWNEAIFEKVEEAMNVDTESILKKMGLR